METNKSVIIILITLIICLGSTCNLGADEAYNLNGEWNAVITREGASTALSTTIENDIITISQKDNHFVGIRNIGGKFVGKNEEMIKGKLLYKMVDEAFIHHVNDPITFELSWADGRATITEKGNKIVIQSFIKSTGFYETLTLTRKK
jgi:hypothetical protein